MAKYTNLTSLFTAIADAIRAKKGTTGKIVADNFPEEIAAIESGGGVDVSGVTATAADVLSPKIIVTANGSKATGTIETKTSDDLTSSGRTVTVPAGYYASDVSKDIDKVSLARPSISVDSNGLISVSVNQPAGYTAGGTSSATKQLSAQASTTITPGTARKTAVASGKYTTGTVYVAGDTNLVASNIASGVSIFGVTGTLLTAVTSSKTPDSHSHTLGVSFTGLGGRQPKNVWWIDCSSDSVPHDGEDICNAIVAGYLAQSSGSSYWGYGIDAYGSKVTIESVTISVSGDSISMNMPSYAFNGALALTVIC